MNIYRLSQPKKGIRLANESESTSILNGFSKRSEEIKKHGFIEEKYREFAVKNIDNYLRKFLGFGKWTSRIDRILLKGMLVKMRSNQRHLLSVRNYVECEAHRELLLRGIEARRNDA